MVKTCVIGLSVKKDHVFGSTGGGTKFGNCLFWPEIKVREALEPAGFRFFSEQELPPEQADIVLCVDLAPAIWNRVMNLPENVIKIFQACESPVYSPLSHDMREGLLTWKGWTAILTWNRGLETDNMRWYDIPVAGIQARDIPLVRADRANCGAAVVSCKQDYCGNSWTRERLLTALSRKGEIDLYGQRWPVDPARHSFGPTDDKIRSLQGHAFGLAMENCYAPGYVTEKLPDCFLAGLPAIYWGDAETAQRLYPGAFVPMESITMESFLAAKEKLFADYETYRAAAEEARKNSVHWCDSYTERMTEVFLSLPNRKNPGFPA